MCGFATAQDWTDWIGPKGGPRLRARLLDKTQYAAQHEADVEVEVGNVWLTDPSSEELSTIPAAALEFRLDTDPPMVTTASRVRFVDLPSGKHSISVGLLGRDNRLLAPRATLELEIPAGKSP